MFIKDILSLWLKRMEVEVAFGVPGSYILPLIDSATRSGIEFILSQHEYGASLMADGYSKSSSKIGCIITTTGIGATNVVSGLLNSWSDSQPVILITGQVPIGNFGKGGMQESVGHGRTVNLELMFSSITKYSKLIVSPDELLEVLNEVEFQLLSGRKGPVHLCIPIDILQTEIDFEVFLPKKALPNINLNSEINQLENYLTDSKKPLLLLGAGTQYGQNCIAIETIADMGIPVATTLRGKGLLDEEHPLSLGCIGLYGESAANYYLDRHADLVIAVGVSMSEFTTQCWDPVFERTRLVHIDIDITQINKIYKADLAIVSSSVLFLQQLQNMVLLCEKSWEEAKNVVEQSKSRFPTIKYLERYHSEELDKMHPMEVVVGINNIIPKDDTIIVSDSVTWTETGLKLRGANKHIEAVNQASIGYAPASAIGVKKACPDKYVISIFGDGGFRQTGLELATARSYDIAVLWINLNNEKYASIFNAQKAYYDGNIVGTTYSPIDFQMFCRSMGIDSILVTNIEELNEGITSFFNNERPMLLDVRIDDSSPVMKARQLIRYQQWKLNESSVKDKDEEKQVQKIKMLIKNRY
ncbi:Acetolactate synthase large subunit [compost metagenome]